MLNTVLCDMLDIRYPVFQGGMAWIADAALASAVSEAGGLGIIASMNSTGEILRQQIREAKEITDKRFGVNLLLTSTHICEAVDVVIEEGISIVTTGAGNPAAHMEKLKKSGVKVFPVVSSVALAKIVEKAGADGVIAEGCESGGIIGEITTMALVPQVADAVSIPVVAAGGIADGRGLAAAIMLGAAGVQMGTRFLTAQECNAHENYKEKVLKARDIDTIVTGKKLGHPVRSLKNPMTRDFAKKEMDGITSDEELEKMAEGSLRRAAVEGDVITGSCMCGQIAGLVKERLTCKEILEQIGDQAEKMLAGNDR